MVLHPRIQLESMTQNDVYRQFFQGLEVFWVQPDLAADHDQPLSPPQAEEKVPVQIRGGGVGGHFDERKTLIKGPLVPL